MNTKILQTVLFVTQAGSERSFHTIKAGFHPQRR